MHLSAHNTERVVLAAVSWLLPWLDAGFSSSFLKSALPGFVSSTQNLVELLRRKADSQEVVLMHMVAILTTLEIICKVRHRALPLLVCVCRQSCQGPVWMLPSGQGADSFLGGWLFHMLWCATYAMLCCAVARGRLALVRRSTCC